MRRQAGFTLVELIISMVILGIIVTVGSMFLASMIKGLVNSRRAAEIGQASQLAMDRIAYEIKNATNQSGSGTVTFTTTPSFAFAFESNVIPPAGATRTIALVGTNLVIDVAGTEHILLEDVNTFTMSVTENNLDGVSGNEISSVNMSFLVTGYAGTFTLDVAPREFLRQ